MTKIMASFDYVVQSHDTIEKIAAHYDCTPSQLMKLNKLTSRVLFPGQKIQVPDENAATTALPSSEIIPTHAASEPSTPVQEGNAFDEPSAFSTPRQQHAQHIHSATVSVPASLDSADISDSAQSFLKLKVKHFTEAEGVVSGVLLVTPNCIMFDPDVMHPLVIENGPDKYSMVAFMDHITSAALYKDLPNIEEGAKVEPVDKNKIYRTRSSDAMEKLVENVESELVSHQKIRKSNSNIDTSTDQQLTSVRPLYKRSFSEQLAEPILKGNDALRAVDKQPKVHSLNKTRHERDKIDQHLDVDLLHPEERNVVTGSPSSCPSALDINNPSTDEQEGSESSKRSLIDNMTNFRRFRPNWRHRANTLGETFVHGTQSLGGSLIQGTHVVGRTVSLGAKAVARVPHNLVSISTGLFVASSGANSGGSGEDKTPDDVFDSHDQDFLSHIDEINNSKREKRKLHRQNKLVQKLKKKTAEKRQNTYFTCATTKEEHPYLFADIEELLPYPIHDICTELPYYFCIRLAEHNKNRKVSHGYRQASLVLASDGSSESKPKSDFWFTIPKSKADALYTFLIHWSPEKYGENQTEGQKHDNNQGWRKSSQARNINDETTFVVLEGSEHVELGEEPAFQSSSFPASLNLNREWEILTVEEVKRRLSLLDLSEPELVPLPEGCEHSLLLNESMIRNLLDVLPPRAQGYPWVQVYSSEHHGFSLGTLYRNMSSWQDELSPTLLVVKDSNQDVFGAIISHPIKLSDLFYGSGESLLYTFYREFQTFNWQGSNHFIVKGNKEGLAVGAGQGTFGLWLDSDLYRGRTQKCQTFENTQLTSSEDFLITGVEAFCFRLAY